MITSKSSSATVAGLLLEHLTSTPVAGARCGARPMRVCRPIKPVALTASHHFHKQHAKHWFRSTTETTLINTM